MKGKLNFDKAFLELQEIQHKIQSNEANVEELSELINRGAELIKYCKTRLRSIEENINEAFKDEEPNS